MNHRNHYHVMHSLSNTTQRHSKTSRIDLNSFARGELYTRENLIVYKLKRIKMKLHKLVYVSIALARVAVHCSPISLPDSTAIFDL